MGNLPRIFLITTHGRQELFPVGRERLCDLLHRCDVPWSAVSIYTLAAGSAEPLLTPCLDRWLDEFADVREVWLYFNRNVNPFLFSLKQFQTIAASEGDQASEYFYQRLDNGRAGAEVYLKKLSPAECRRIVADRVRDTVLATIPAGAGLVAGISGGGDSNALLHALGQLRDHDLKIYPVIIKGIPEWDRGVPRAQALCAEYGLELTVLEERDVKELLNIPPDSLGLIERFERVFKGDDFEFLGTLLVRLALIKKAREVGTSYICTGLNLEDVLSEAMFRVSSGMQPAPFPTRAIGEITMAFPLWLCPKRIIDGCFPRMSLENYDARYPCFSLGRNLYYSVIYSMQSQFPGYLEQLAHGMSELAMAHPVKYELDEQLGFHVERFVPFPLRQKFIQMLGEA